jgi:hypothetical protein
MCVRLIGVICSLDGVGSSDTAGPRIVRNFRRPGIAGADVNEVRTVFHALQALMMQAPGDRQTVQLARELCVRARRLDRSVRFLRSSQLMEKNILERVSPLNQVSSVSRTERRTESEGFC